MVARNLAPSLLRALRDTPVVFLQGARQTGKSTLAQSLTIDGASIPYVSLDDAAALAASDRDPEAFVGGLPLHVVLDEVQRVPRLLLAVKREVDRNRLPGRFLLTGSANVLSLAKASESLAGRMEIHTLWPLSQGELASRTEGFVEAVFGDTLPEERKTSRQPPGSPGEHHLTDRLLAGGYPEALDRSSADRRRAWFGSYVTAILQRDVRDLARIEGLTDLPRLLSIIAAREGQLLNLSEVSRSSGLALSTLRRYVALLETTFLVVTLAPWSTNVGKRFVKTPKIVMADSGLACALLGLDRDRLRRESELMGRIVEGFVAMEIRKQAGWSGTAFSLFHYRTHAQREVDLVLEGPAGRVVGIEVKATQSLGSDAAAGLLDLAEAAGKRFRRGVILYLGEAVVSFAPGISAVPLDRLWRW